LRKRVSVSPNTWLNLRRRGVSASARVGRATVSSTGRVSVRLLPGLSFRFGRTKS
jgi:hypothetical protein